MFDQPQQPIAANGPRQDSGRLEELDALRGLAALSVLVMHYTVAYDRLFQHQDPIWFRNPLGGYGVELFFMLSGFVITMSLDRAKNVAEFATSRFARLYPVYWAAMLLTFAVVSGCGLPGKETSLADAAANTTMLHGVFGFKHVDEVYWTLQCELQFYLVMGVILACGWRRHLTGILSLLTLIALVDTHVGFTSWSHTGLWRIGHYLPLPYFYLFLTGAVFYESRTGWRRSHFVMLVLGLASIAHREPLHIGLVIGIAGLFLAASRGRLPWLSNRVLVFLGTISYSLYLIHQNIGYVVIRQGYQLGWNGNVSILAATTVSLLLACVLTSRIERPAHRWLRGYFQSVRRHGLTALFRFQTPSAGSTPIQSS